MRTGHNIIRCLAVLAVVASALGCGRGKVRTRAGIEALAADPGRDAWQKPDEIFAAVGIAPGQQVVDLGAAEGYLVPHLSRAVGADGVVVAVEFEDDLVDKLRARVQASRLANVRVHLVQEGELPGTGLYDRVVMLDSYGALAAPVGTLERTRARLRAGGKLVVIGHKRDEAIPGPPLDERLDAETVIAEARGAGFGEPESQRDLGRQWMVVFRHDPAAVDQPSSGGADAPPAETP